MAATSPLPPIQDDPALVAARQVVPAFTEQAAAIRRNVSLSDVAMAQAVVDLYDAATADLARLYTGLCTRQQARIDTLAGTVPVGPNVPDDTSPADGAVMWQAWRAALAQARDATGDELTAMFTDAQRFDDDTLRRACLTVAIDTSRIDLVNSWAESFGLSDQLTELAYLRDLVAGRGFDSLWISAAFQAVPKPPEVYDLPALLAMQGITRDASGRVHTATRFEN